MAEEVTASTIFPPPPPFYKHFTAQNLERLTELKERQSEIPGLSSAILDLPPELRYLVPPEPPADGSYRSFGETVDVRMPGVNMDTSG
jgi:mediator of RNA polymerase II transcription subunit 7